MRLYLVPMGNKKDQVFELYQQFINALDDMTEYRVDIITREEIREWLGQLRDKCDEVNRQG